MYVCVDDGAPGGLPIGHVIGTAGGVWLAYAPVPQGDYFGFAQVARGLPTCDAAIRAEEPQGITRLGDDKVRFTEAAVAYLRKPPPPLSLFIEVQGDDLVLDFMTYKLIRDR